MGKEGSLISAPSVPKTYIPGYHVERVVDPIGAGDAFASRVLSGLLDGLSLVEAARRGNAMVEMDTMVNGDVEGVQVRADLAFFKEGANEAGLGGPLINSAKWFTDEVYRKLTETEKILGFSKKS